MSNALECVKLLDLCLLLSSVTMADGDVHSILKCATVNTTNGDTTCIARVVERCDKHLWCTLELLWCRNLSKDKVEKVVEVISWVLPVRTHPALLS